MRQIVDINGSWVLGKPSQVRRYCKNKGIMSSVIGVVCNSFHPRFKDYLKDVDVKL